MAKSTTVESAIFRRFADQVYEINRILSFSMNGIARETAAPKVVEAIESYKEMDGKPSSPEVVEKQRAEAHARAAFAQAQIDSGFPVLYAHATVAIWGAIEVLVEDLVVDGLMSDKKYLEKEALRKIRIPLAEYESLEPIERFQFLARELARQTNSDLKHGVGRFESLLDTVGLGGALSQELRRTCLEFGEVRNLIVHRAGTADRRFVDSCPWLNATVGDAFRIDSKSYAKYREFANQFLVELLVRAAIRFGAPPSKAEKIRTAAQASDAFAEAVVPHAGVQ